MSNTSLMGGERISCIPSTMRRGSTMAPLMNIFTIDQVLRRQSRAPIDDTLDENFLNVSCIVVDDRDPFDDQIRRQILDKRGVTYALMENYSVEKSNLPPILAKNKIGTKIEKVTLGLSPSNAERFCLFTPRCRWNELRIRKETRRRRIRLRDNGSIGIGSEGHIRLQGNSCGENG